MLVCGAGRGGAVIQDRIIIYMRVRGGVFAVGGGRWRGLSSFSLRVRVGRSVWLGGWFTGQAVSGDKWQNIHVYALFTYQS